MNLVDHVAMIEQQQAAPVLVQDVINEEDVDALAEVCAEVETVLREECQDRDLSKHAGQAACYMVVNRLANPEEVSE